MNPIRIACIGSRDISEKTKDLMIQIGNFIVSQNWYISSGNAIGSDYAFATGGNQVNPKNVILYLPWENYNENQVVKGNRCTSKLMPEWEEVARIHHPAYEFLSKGVKRLMVRNAGIVLKANKVVAYLNISKKGGGGTGHSVRIAQSLDIPIFLVNNQTLEDDIKKWLLV